jgi:RNA polymerase sigma-70 factor (ECF subfamily)
MVRSMAAEAAIDADAGAVLGAARDPSLERSRADDRLRACVTAHLAAVWRMLRRNGVPAADADDASQKVFLVLSRKLKDVQPGRELPFLLRTAVLVASDVRRTHRRQREVSDPAPEAHSSILPGPEGELLQREALSQLDAILAAMEESLRATFVLYELEEMTMAAIAETLEIPLGTVASRLRRARDRFESLAEMVRNEHGGEQ